MRIVALLLLAAVCAAPASAQKRKSTRTEPAPKSAYPSPFEGYVKAVPIPRGRADQASLSNLGDYDGREVRLAGLAFATDWHHNRDGTTIIILRDPKTGERSLYGGRLAFYISEKMLEQIQNRVEDDVWYRVNVECLVHRSGTAEKPKVVALVTAIEFEPSKRRFETEPPAPEL